VDQTQDRAQPRVVDGWVGDAVAGSPADLTQARFADELAEDAQQARFDDELTEQDAPFEVPQPPQTGDPVVDEAVVRVAAAVQLPLDDQVGVYDAVHRALQDRLADVED